MARDQSGHHPGLPAVDAYASPRTRTSAERERSFRQELIELGTSTFLLGFFGVIVCAFLTGVSRSPWGLGLGVGVCVGALAVAVQTSLRRINGEVAPVPADWHSASVVSVAVVSVAAGAFGFCSLLVALFASFAVAEVP